MTHLKTLILGVAATASVLVPLADANAWVAAGRGWGGRGFVAAVSYTHLDVYKRQEEDEPLIRELIAVAKELQAAVEALGPVDA